MEVAADGEGMKAAGVEKAFAAMRAVGVEKVFAAMRAVEEEKAFTARKASGEMKVLVGPKIVFMGVKEKDNLDMVKVKIGSIKAIGISTMGIGISTMEIGIIMATGIMMTGTIGTIMAIGITGIGMVLVRRLLVLLL